MFADRRITKVLQSSEVLHFDNQSNIVLISDCHRGDGGWADDFVKNRVLYLAALDYYFYREFLYIELGDGDELWAKNNYSNIVSVHRDVFRRLTSFCEQGRLYLLYGNHDIDKKKPSFAKRRPFCSQPVPFREGLVLRHSETDGSILLLHGHQADFFNDRMWRLSRFLVRYVWKPLELIGIKDPTSTSKNANRKDLVERTLIEWIEKHRTMLVAGHTHRPAFSKPGDAPYFNSGSCVHPYQITALEITGGDIQLVGWRVRVRKDGTLYVGREVLDGPGHLRDYFLPG